ncbi:MAG: hypothetical protein HRU72_00100 [Planctomycetia bacterium]|nr:hypothetical protein [Candidatus Brocadia sp.]QOJ05069.1 MAG: hypothetical protein HRU72_00100 [Planctomycetia bacterium]GJQ24523.1 MAG: hypothetical protein HBSAPP01_23130 [Candidatus Brocadia sapporoensis]HQU29994.1 hypothetical protein [Candidatus Brocadia sapporoensis]
MEYFAELEIMEFALIPDAAQDGGLIHYAIKEMASAQAYGCGCFWFRKTDNNDHR